MIFAGVFDRYPKLRVGSVEHEAAWIPHWLTQMDFTYRERPVFTRGWKSKEGRRPCYCAHSHMSRAGMGVDLGVQLRHTDVVDNLRWGRDFPHSESTLPQL